MPGPMRPTLSLTSMKPLSEDTSLEAEKFLFELYAEMEPHEKMAIIWRLNRQVENAALAGILDRHPDADEEEQKLRLFALKYGRDLAVEVFGWDPEVEGW